MTVPAEYNIPAATASAEYEIKKSRFLAFACRAEDRAQAMAQVDAYKHQFPDARHHCWAYVLGDPHQPRSLAMSDDGEPSGTAGKPILNVLQHKHVGDIVVVVVRYFGGIKLGAGGLVRAYSSAAQLVMEQLHLQRKVQRCHCELQVAFAQEQALRHWANVHGAAIVHCDYADEVVLTLAVAHESLHSLAAFAESIGGHITLPENLRECR